MIPASKPFRAALCAAVLLGACGVPVEQVVSRAGSPAPRRVEDSVPTRAERELGVYYKEVQAAFDAGDAMRLAATFDPAITKPMTYPQIIDWGKKFFGIHKTAKFVIDGVKFELAGEDKAVVLLTYHVETPTGEGNFGGTERDYLTRAVDGWKVTAWEKIK